MPTISSRERVLAAAAHKTTDRIPVDYCARMDVANNLTAYFGLKDLEELYLKLGVDIRRISVGEHHASFTERVNGTLEGHSENSGVKFIFRDDGTYENAWGVVNRLSADGLYDEWITGPFAGTMDLDSFHWPDFTIFDPVETLRKSVDKYEGKYAVSGSLNYPFKVCWQMRGLENFLCDMIIEPDFAKELLQKAASYEKEKGLRMIRAGVDILALYGDIAMQDRMMVNVSAWRNIDKPVFAELISAFKKENQDILIFYHSDGNMEEVMPDLIEIGVDIVNPIQPECMDAAKIKKIYGDKITMHGTISIQETLPHGTLEDVRNEVRERMNTCGKEGGFIVCPANLVQNDTPLENIIEIYKTVGAFKD